MKPNSEKTVKEKFNVLIEFFLIKDDKRIWGAVDFSREMFAAKKLISNYPDFDFFYYLPELNNKFNSLLGLLTKENKNKLDLEYNRWQNNKEIKLEDKPLMELELKEKKPKDILEFLDS